MPAVTPSLKKTKDHASSTLGWNFPAPIKDSVQPLEIKQNDMSSITNEGFPGLMRLSAFSRTEAEPIQSKNSPRLPGKQQVYRKVCEWFESWQPWQQRILLCGATNRCSLAQLESLATTLEPVFHRDFINTVQKRYPCAPFHSSKKLNREETAEVISLIADRHLLSPQKKSGDRCKTPQSQKSASFKTEDKNNNDIEKPDQDTVSEEVSTSGSTELLEKFSDDFSKSIIQDALNVVKVSSQEDVHGNLSNEKVQPKSISFDIDVVSALDTDIHINLNDELSASSEESVHISSNKTEEDSSPKKSKKKSAKSHSKIPDVGKLGLLARSFYPEDCLILSQGIISSPVLNVSSSAQDFSPPTSKLTLHRHRSTFNSAEVRTGDFFAKGKMDKLGPVQMQMRTGQVRRPPDLNDVDIPAQRLFKNAKLWRSTPVDGHSYVKPRKNNLKLLFRNQIEQVWKWLSEWKEHERLAFLVEIVKICSEAMISYLAQCLSQRLHERVDIGWLSDKQLLRLFSYLSPVDIDVCAQVCRRWKYLCSVDALWIQKCQQTGIMYGISDIRALIQKATKDDESIDWRLAYLEIARIVQEASLALPTADKRKDKDYVGDHKGLVQVGEKQRAKRSDLFVQRGKSTQLHVDQQKQVDKLPLVADEETDVGDDIDLNFMDKLGRKSVFGKPRMLLFGSHAPPDQEVKKTGDFGVFETAFSEERPIASVSAAELSMAPSRSFRRLPKLGAHSGEEEIALDIRPELIQTKDLLGKSSSHYNLKWREVNETTLREKYQKFAGYVKGVKRVRRLQGHMDAVVCVQCDMRRLISGSKDRVIRIWDIRSGTCVHKLYGHKGGIRCLKLFENKLISGSWDMAVMVWDLVKFNREGFLTGHKGVVTSVDVTGDKRYIVSSSHDGTLRLWCMLSYACLRVFAAHEKDIVFMTCDGNNIFTLSTDKTIQITESDTLKRLQVFSGVESQSLCLTVVNDLILTGDDRGQVHFWNRKTGELEASIQAHEQAINSITFHKGRFFTASVDATIKEWDLITMTCVRSLHGHKGPVNDFKVLDKRLVSCCEDGNVRVWDLFVPLLRLGTRADDDNIPTEVINKREEFWGL